MLRRTLRRCQGLTSVIGDVHPDTTWHIERKYAGPGWSAMLRQLPYETLMMQGGSTMTNMHDRNGTVQDPEDPRHPLALIVAGTNTNVDAASLNLAQSRYEPVSPGTRLMQVLYENYLEPFSMNRVCAHLCNFGKVPNTHHEQLALTAAYIGQTASIVGEVLIGNECVILEGVTIKADTHVVSIGNSAVLMENTYVTSDTTTDVLAYRLQDDINPYQQWDGMEGMTYVGVFTIVEPNCYLDSCDVGDFNRIGHNSKLLKGVRTGSMVHILPGSVVTADTVIPEGEIWGGAPAVKLGMVGKNEWKRPLFPTLFVRDATWRLYEYMSADGDQVVHFRDAMRALDAVTVQYEEDVTPAVRAQIDAFVRGREPLHYTITRLSQDWVPSGRPEEKLLMTAAPLPGVKLYAEHNTDSSDSELHGTYLNITNFFNDFRW